MNRIYASIDLKSFFASVECRQRGLDPLKTNLVVADKTRTEKTVCLAVTPSLKSYGIKGRARLFEVIQKVNEVNFNRRMKIENHQFIGKSYLDDELKLNKELELDYIIAPPQMSKYMKYSTSIYNTYLKYISKDDMFVYSIDEIFCDITKYLNTYKMTAQELVTKMIQDVYDKTGITATAGIGTNMYLCKIAMDIVAKHKEPNNIGVRIAYLDEMTYRKELWKHRPLTDFWRVGAGYSKKLEANGMFTMGDVARCSIANEELLYKLFGVNAELLIDHAWGYEPTKIEDVKSYTPKTTSLSSGQVLHCPYNCTQTELIIKEMADLLSLNLVSKQLATNQLVLTIEYDVSNLTNYSIRQLYNEEIVTDRYGRKIPKHSHGTLNLDDFTSSARIIIDSFDTLYKRIINKNLLVRKLNLTVNNLLNESEVPRKDKFEQVNIFIDYERLDKEKKEKDKKIEEEKSLQKAIIKIKDKYGKNAILKGMNLEKDGTTIQRNGEIGGHKG